MIYGSSGHPGFEDDENEGRWEKRPLLICRRGVRASCGSGRSAVRCVRRPVTTYYKEISRQRGAIITALLPRGRRHHYRLGRRSPHPLPSSKPAGSREEVNNLAGGAWRGLEECWGIWENFRVTFGLGGGRVEQKWKLYHPNHLSCLYFVVSAWHGLVAKVLANKNEIKLQ